MILIHRKEHFNAAHRLYNPAWSSEKNKEVFGLCANENWHGHNFELVVSVQGKPDPETGFIVDFKKLSALIKKEIIEPVDHRNLNVDVPFMAGKLASCENLVVEFWKILAPEIPLLNPNASLYQLRLVETVGNFVDYFGPEHAPR